MKAEKRIGNEVLIAAIKINRIPTTGWQPLNKEGSNWYYIDLLSSILKCSALFESIKNTPQRFFFAECKTFPHATVIILDRIDIHIDIDGWMDLETKDRERRRGRTMDWISGYLSNVVQYAPKRIMSRSSKEIFLVWIFHCQIVWYILRAERRGYGKKVHRVDINRNEPFPSCSNHLDKIYW